MDSETRNQIEAHRINTLKKKYYERIKAFRQAMSNRNLFSDRSMLMLWNEAEKAYKLAGKHFGDDGSKGYP